MNKFALFLIFLSIIALGIAVFIVIKPLNYFAKKEDAIRRDDLMKITRALEQYHADYGRYPSFDPEKYEIVVQNQLIPWNADFSPYLNPLPSDPNPHKKYVYYPNVDDNYQSYRIYASLDDPNSEPLSCGDQNCPGVPGKNLCGVNFNCNYAVTSGNISP